MNNNIIMSKCKFVISIIIMMLGSLSAFADDVDETFQFMDKDGNIIADGTELVCDEAETDDWGGVLVRTGLFVKSNATDDKVLAKVQCVIEEIPDNSSIQCCFPANCMMFNQGAGTYNNGPAAYGSSDFQTEWFPATDDNYEYVEGQCKATFQLFACTKKTFGSGFNEKAGPKIHVTFRYKKTAIHTNNLQMKVDEHASLGINLTDAFPYVAFQMDLCLPDGVSLNKSECRLGELFADQNLTIGKLDEGVYRLVGTSMSLTPITERNGELLNLSVVANKDIVSRGYIRNICFARKYGSRICCDDVSFDISTNNHDIEPSQDGTGGTDYGEGGEIDDDTNLDGNVIGNIYYNISDENGEYSSTEGCIILRKSSDDENLEGMDLFGEDLRNHFTGIIFMVNGKGTIKVTAETVGSMTLKVKIGNNDPFTMELEGKLKVTVPYDVTVPTYVYIYGGETPSSNAKGMFKSESSGDALKIYGIEWKGSSMPTGITSNSRHAPLDTPLYNLNGQRVLHAGKGIYIKNGKKIMIK